MGVALSKEKGQLPKHNAVNRRQGHVMATLTQEHVGEGCVRVEWITSVTSFCAKIARSRYRKKATDIIVRLAIHTYSTNSMPACGTRTVWLP